MKTETALPRCPIRYSLELLSGKWKLPIICSLSSGVKRWGELKRTLPGITNTMLANTLAELSEAGLVDRRQYNEMPLRVEYSLTPEGRKLSPILGTLGQWAIGLMASRTDEADEEPLTATG